MHKQGHRGHELEISFSARPTEIFPSPENSALQSFQVNIPSSNSVDQDREIGSFKSIDRPSVTPQNAQGEMLLRPIFKTVWASAALSAGANPCSKGRWLEKLDADADLHRV
jgi:hypothetical protein